MEPNQLMLLGKQSLFIARIIRNTLHLYYGAQSVNAVRETVAVYCENHTEHTDTLCRQNAELKQEVPRESLGFT
jgi:hypothetical protein